MDEPQAEAQRRAQTSARLQRVLGFGNIQDLQSVVQGRRLLVDLLGNNLSRTANARHVLSLLTGLSNNPAWNQGNLQELHLLNQRGQELGSIPDIIQANRDALHQANVIGPDTPVWFPKGFLTAPGIVLQADAQLFSDDSEYNLQFINDVTELKRIAERGFGISSAEYDQVIRSVRPTEDRRSPIAIQHAQLCLGNSFINLLYSPAFQRVMLLFLLSARNSDQMIMNVFSTNEVFNALQPGNIFGATRSRNIFQLIDLYKGGQYRAETTSGFTNPTTAIQATIWEMQSIPLLAYTIQVLWWMAAAQTNFDGPGLEISYSFRVHTRRFIQNDVQRQAHYAETECPSVHFGSPGNALTYNGNQSSLDIMNEILDAMIQIYYGRSRGNNGYGHGSNFLDLDDTRCDIAVSGLTIIIHPANSFEPRTLAQGYVATSAATISIIQNLQAYGIPNSLGYRWRQLSLKFANINTQHCVVESFCHLRALSVGYSDTQSYLTALLPQYAQTPGMICTHLGTTMQLCLTRIDPEHFFNCPNFQTIDMCFFAGFGKAPKIPCATFYAVYEDDQADIEVDLCDHLVYSALERADDAVCLIYHEGHVFPGTFGLFRQAIDASFHTKADSIDQSVWSGEHIQHTLRRIDWSERRIQNGQREFDAAKAAGRITNADLIQVFSSGKNIHKLSADFETGHCENCSKLYDYDAQDAFCASIAYGTSPSQCVNFFGHECAERAKLSSFNEFDGCVTQMLVWIRENLGFRYLEVESGELPAGTIRRFIYFYNGANFDIHFIHRVLLGWNEPIDIIPMDGAIISLQWGNITFLDFYRLFPAGTLDNCFESFREFHVPESRFMPRLGKWKCFPYGLISDKKYKVSVLLEDMADPEIWGEKLIDGNVENNLVWWREHVSSVGYIPEQHLTDYCASDVLLLQYMVMVENNHIAVGKYTTPNEQGVMEERWYDTTDCLTASSAAMHMFQQAFLFKSITTAFLDNTIDVFDARTQRFLTLQRVWDMSYMGGKVDLFRHDIHHPEDKPHWDTLFDRTGQKHVIDEYDFNSMYPACMLGEIPIQFRRFVPYDGVVLDTNVVDTDLFWAEVQYPKHQSGILSRAMHRCVALNFIPHTFHDPQRPDTTQYSFIWGVEINQAMDDGATIRVFGKLEICLLYTSDAADE